MNAEPNLCGGRDSPVKVQYCREESWEQGEGVAPRNCTLVTVVNRDGRGGELGGELEARCR